MGSAGLQPIQAAGRFDVAQLVLVICVTISNVPCIMICWAILIELQHLQQRVAERMADLSRRIGSAFGRLQVELSATSITTCCSYSKEARQY